jgi:hypothetical protein
MTDNFTATKNAVLAKLQGLTKLKYVYAYEKGEKPGFPTCTLYGSEYIADWTTNFHDLDTYVFTIRVYQEMATRGAESAEAIIDNALIELIQAFQTDYTLGGKIDKMSIRARKGWVTAETENRIAEITLTTSKLVAI